MMRIFLAMLLIAYASAFIPSRLVPSKQASSLMMSEKSRSMPFLNKPKGLDGYVGSEDFDPFGFAENFDIRFLREAELKHCRVAMLATVGWLFQLYGPHLPSPDGTYDVINPIDAFFHVGPSPIFQIFAFIGALESLNHNGKLSMVNMFENSDREPGSFTNPIYGAGLLKGKTKEQIDDLKLKELRNGRLAMFAIGGLVHHSIVGGSETFGPFPNPALWGL